MARRSFWRWTSRDQRRLELLAAALKAEIRRQDRQELRRKKDTAREAAA